MKTNIIMNRPMGMFNVEQRTSDGYFEANSLLQQWNKLNKRKLMLRFFNCNKTKEFLEIMEYKNGNINFIFYDKNTWSIIKIDKGENTRYGKTPDKIWMETYMFLFFCKYLDVNLYASCHEYLKENNILKDNNVIEVVSYRDELKIYDVLKKASNIACPMQNVYSQYPCLNNKYRIDILIEYIHKKDSEEDRDSVCYTIIEFDEEQHNLISNMIKDNIREKEITQYLYDLAIGNNQVPDINILRIKKGHEGYFYAYALPYLTYIETSYCFDKMNKYLDYRNLFCYNGDNTYFNYYKINTDACDKLL